MKEPVSAAVNEEVDGNERAVRCSENLTPGGKRSPDSPLLIPMLFIYSINTNWALLHATTSRLQRCLNSGPCFLLVEGTEQVTDLVVRPGVGRDIILRDRSYFPNDTGGLCIGHAELGDLPNWYPGTVQSRPKLWTSQQWEMSKASRYTHAPTCKSGRVWKIRRARVCTVPGVALLFSGTFHLSP